VVQCDRLDEARRLLQSRPFDLVICEMDFVGATGRRQSGQEFLEDVRRERLAPLATAFIMATAESAFAKVAEAAEAALDSKSHEGQVSASESGRLDCPMRPLPVGRPARPVVALSST
jgi:hypothetical protein